MSRAEADEAQASSHTPQQGRLLPSWMLLLWLLSFYSLCVPTRNIFINWNQASVALLELLGAVPSCPGIVLVAFKQSLE